MKENEAVMAMRMQKIAEEKMMMERKIWSAAVCIQRHARGMIARVAFKRRMD
jgi:IQ calmodulin-binding motif